MKKLIALVLLSLSGCVVTPSGYAPVYVEPTCCVIVAGVPGFYYHGQFYPRHYWHPGFGRPHYGRWHR